MSAKAMQWLVKKIPEWREHPSQMVRELFDVNPEPWQEEALENYGKVPRLAMIANKGPGKTFVLSMIAINFLLTRPYPKMAATSISGDNLSDGFWTEMSKWISKSPLLSAMFTWTKTRIFNTQQPNNWWMSARTWPKSGSAEEQANTLAGLHDDYIMFILDEAGSIPMAVMAAAEAALTGGPKEAHVIQAGNPTSLSGPLYQAHMNRHLWYVINITGDPDNPKRSRRMSVEYAREQIKLYGATHPYVLVNIFGEFPPSSLNTLIGPDEVRAAFNRYYRPYELRGQPKIIGVDISRYGDDSSVLAFRHGMQMFNFEQFRNIDGNQGAAIVHRRWHEFEADAVFLDGTGGFGTSWEDNLKRLGRQPFSVHFNGSPHEKLRFDNRRAEMYWDLCEWIRAGGALPPDEELLKELTETTYSVPKDVIFLEPKKDVKARIGRSPDKADAACFVANTRITTPEGEKNISEIVEGDLITTPFGVSKVVKTWALASEKLVTVTFSDGSKITGTPDHEVFVFGHGLTRLDALTFTMATSPLKERWKWRMWSGLNTRARRIGFKKLVSITARENLSSESACCIGACGSSVRGPYQKVFTSIIETMTGRTIVLKTWKSYLEKSMKSFTLKSVETSVDVWPKTVTSTECGSWPLNGIGQKKVVSGTKNTARKLGSIGITSSSSAKRAAQPEPAGTRTERVTVRQLALNGLSSTLNAISRMCAFASGAVKSLWQTGTCRLPVVPVHVLTENVAPTAVYNLTLEHDNAYYADGILVFNCLTFAETVTPIHAAPLRRINRNVAEYDPFGETVDRRVNAAYSSPGEYNPFG